MSDNRLIEVKTTCGLSAWIVADEALRLVQAGRCTLAQPGTTPPAPVTEGRRIYENLVRGLQGKAS